MLRRLAYEAADCGLLSADLATGIRRVKGAKKLGIRLGNWLTPEQAKSLWQAPDTTRLRGKRDCALLAIFVACGLRRHEIAELTVDHLQQREGHWAIVDMIGKGRHMRTIPMPDWVHGALSQWMTAAGVHAGKLFRKVNSAGKPWGDGVTEKLVWHVVKEFAPRIGNDRLAPMTCAGHALASVGQQAENLSRFSFCSAMSRYRRLNATSAAHNELPPP